MDKETRTQVISEFQKGPKDTGSSQVQIALLTARIRELTAHLRVHKKDDGTRRGLLKLVGRRRRYLAYLARENTSHYREVISRLGLRQ